MKAKILLVERDRGGNVFLRQILESQELNVIASTPAEVLTLPSGVSAVFCELSSGRQWVFDLLSRCRDAAPSIPFVLIVEEGDVDSAVLGMKLGAADCLTAPVDSQKVRRIVEELIQQTPAPQESGVNDTQHGKKLDIPAGTSLEELERAAVEQALAHHAGNRTHAANELGISVRTLQRKLKSWGPSVLMFQGLGNGHNFVRQY
jgi:DNA-binding NtrC family response regulator